MTVVPHYPREATTPYYRSTLDTAFVRINDLDDEAKDAYLRNKGRLAKLHKVNKNLLDRYRDSYRVQTLDIAIPPHLTNLQVAAGMQSTGIDVINEKLRWDTYVSDGGDLLGLDELAIQSRIILEMMRAQQEALICGVGFVSVGAGDPRNFEPDVLVNAESPIDATVTFDRKQRRVTDGYARHVNEAGVVDMETLYLLDRNIFIQRNDKGELVVVDVDQHNANHCFLRPLVNRGRASRLMGSTDLTPAAQYYADAEVRTLLAMEINREFYTTPQRWLMGADMSMFKDENGNPVSTWQAVAGLMLAAPAPMMEDPDTGEMVYGAAPKVGQFQAAPPQPYIDQGRDYRLKFATEVGFPPTYMGYIAGENPASADAIKALAQRLTDLTLNRQDGFNYDQQDISLSMLIVRDGRAAITEALLKELRRITPNWTDPRPDTQAADTDMVTKWVASQMVQPTSRVARRRAGMTEQEIGQLEQEDRIARARARAAERAAIAAGQQPGTVPAPGDTPPTPTPQPPASV
jgi:hypothetical protein